jgi:lipoprotein-anchoring transpeptidase ErfK/SrfK
VVLGVDDGPNSDGSEAAQFIEVDLSQQKMYLWKGGRMERSYQVSTGLYYPTPTGEYAIMNKADNAFSAIFGVYMPFWMAFNYQNDIGAYVGIHELPYKLVNGLKVYRFGNYIGSKKTGGCVALNPGEAKEVYDWANVGTRVRTFD